MADFNYDSGRNSSADSAANSSNTALFIKIKLLPRIAHGRDLRLREEDIILAIDGKAYNEDIDNFRELCDQAEEREEELLLTICRGEILYDVLITKKLGVELEYCDAEVSNTASTLFSKHLVGPKDQYCNYEALRDVQRNVVLYGTAYSSVATIAPPLWLLQHRAWEPLIAVIVAYVTALVVHWAVFIATVLLMAVYFHRIQFRLIRNYSLFTEHYFWHVCAARNPAEAQMICRQIDPKCNFDFSHVGPPIKSGKTEHTERQVASFNSECSSPMNLTYIVLLCLPQASYCDKSSHW